MLDLTLTMRKSVFFKLSNLSVISFSSRRFSFLLLPVQHDSLIKLFVADVAFVFDKYVETRST